MARVMGGKMIIRFLLRASAQLPFIGKESGGGVAICKAPLMDGDGINDDDGFFLCFHVS